MTNPSHDNNRRSVTVSRTGPANFTATNARGGAISVGSGGEQFTPVELLLAAIGACSGIDVDMITSKRARPDEFTVTISGEKVRDANGNHLQDIDVSFQVAFPDGDDGNKARSVLQSAVEKSRDRLCTVSRTVALPTHVAMRVEN